MAELCFIRHGPRSDLSNAPPLYPDASAFDQLVTVGAIDMAAHLAEQIFALALFGCTHKKNVSVHFSPYLRCCQSADLLVSALKSRLTERIPEAIVRFQLLCDFALSEWIHDQMKNKPPYIDSTEAYQMYTPNLQAVKNRDLVLNFRPTTLLGPWNEPGLSFKQFLERCRTYFKKLLATYEGESHQNDLVVVVTHGYVVSNILSFFTGHPVFEEIPEYGFNFATKRSGQWVLKKDCLGVLECDPYLNGNLKLETDIVYYKTNFTKKTNFNPNKQYPGVGFQKLKADEPRQSFRIRSVKEGPINAQNPLCSAARDWNAQDSNKFTIKAMFKMKAMQDSAFKKAFSIVNPPIRPVTPEVSPSLAPERSNSTINLSKLHSNEDIHRPLKLRYSLASDIPVGYLNSKLNSQVNSHLSLLHFNGRSSNRSSLDLDRNDQLLIGQNSPHDKDAPLTTNMNEVVSRLSRIRSLQRRRQLNSTPNYVSINESGDPDKDDLFTLQFNISAATESKSLDALSLENPPSAPLTASPAPRSSTHLKCMFYSFSSNSSDELDDNKDDQYVWFGQNFTR